MRRFAAGLLLAFTLAAALGLAGEARADTNSTNAQLCQQGGWETLLRPDMTAFTNSGDCTSYGATGGSYVSPGLTITSTFFSPDDPICYGIGDYERCRGFIVSGAALDPTSTVTIIFNSWWIGLITQYVPVNPDGTVWVAWRFSCHAGGTVWASGTSASGLPVNPDPEVIVPVC